MSYLDVALASFWQIPRHWKPGDTAKLELLCEAGSLHMQLTAKLGHPDQPHYPSSTLQQPLKKKSPSQMRGQERWKQLLIVLKRIQVLLLNIHQHLMNQKISFKS